MNNNTIKYATLLAMATVLISGTANFINKIEIIGVKDPIVFTTLKNAMVALFLAGLLLALKKRGEIASLTKSQIFKLIAICAVGGSIPFALFFTGLAQTSALNAGLIHKTLFIWVLFLAVPLLKEKIHKWQWLGIGAVFTANFLVGGFTGFKYNTGELMILGATMLWAIENIIAKTALKDLSSITVASSRMIIGTLILALFVLWRGGGSAVFELNGSNWGWTILTSGLLLGYVLTWYTALKYAPATYVATLLVPATLVTNILSAIFITHSFMAFQFLSGLLFMGGTALIIFFAAKAEKQITAPEPNFSTSTI